MTQEKGLVAFLAYLVALIVDTVTLPFRFIMTIFE